MNVVSRLGALALVLAVLPGCVSSKDIEALQAQLADIQRQVLQLQMQSSSKEEVAGLQRSISGEMEDLLKSEADMQVRLDSLSRQIEQLQSSLEDNNYQQAQLSQQLAAILQELKAARTGAAANESGSPTNGTNSTVVATDPKAIYDTAYNDYLRGNYDLAILGFREYLQTFPDTELSDNAYYWIGECYYSQAKHEQASREFETVLNRFPHSDKVAGAMLKRGYALLADGERQSGIVQLRALVSDHPASDEAQLARQRLRELGVD